MTADVFIPTIYKDFNKLKFTIETAITHVKGCGDFYVTLPNKADLKDIEYRGHKITFFNDSDILPGVDARKCRFRTNWIWQQLLKLCQDKTQTEYVWICDSDLMFIKDFDIFAEDGRPILHAHPNEKDDIGFSRFIAMMSKGDLLPELLRPEMDDEEFYRTDYVADMMVFKPAIIDEMLKRYDFADRREFCDWTLEHTFWNAGRVGSYYISEYQLYGLYVQKHHPSEYVRRDIESFKIDQNQMMDQNVQMFPDEYIAQTLARIANDKSREWPPILKLQSNCGVANVYYKGIDEKYMKKA